MATTEGLVLDSLDFNAGSYGLRELTLPIPRKRPEWIEGVDADGALLMRDPLVSNGQCIARVEVTGSSRDNAHTLVGAIVDKLEEADRQPGGITLVWTPADSTKSLTFYVLSGEVTELPVTFESGYFANVISLQVTMDCRPGGYGAEITGPTVTTTGPIVTLEVPDVLGDMPSDEARLVITDTSSQSRRHVEWGQEQRYYNPASPWALILDSDSLVTSGFAGTQTTRAGAYDPGAAGNSIIAATVFSTATAVCSTGTQPHIGTFRVKARVWCSPDVYVRLAWAVGDGSYTLNNWALPAVSAEYAEVDLGLISIPAAVAGTQSWTGRIDSYTSTGAASSATNVDYLLLVPAGEGYGRARAAYIAQPGVIVARDDFTSTTASGALNARVAPAGGTWATSGDATDFVFADDWSGEQLKRTAVSGTAGRFGVLGTTNYTGVQVEGAVLTQVSGLVTSATIDCGLIARWTDSSNHLRAVLRRSFDGTGVEVDRIEIKQIVAGTPTVIATATLPSVSLLATWYALRLVVVDNGQVTFDLLTSTKTTVIATATGWSATLATGGTLATGKPGIFDLQTSASPTWSRYYDDIAVSQLPASPVALYSGRTLEVRSATAIRQNSAGTIYALPPYRGSRFVLQPAGSADRTTRVVGKAHRNDIESGAADQIADQLKIQVFYRPRYSTVPR